MFSIKSVLKLIKSTANWFEAEQQRIKQTLDYQKEQEKNKLRNKIKNKMEELQVVVVLIFMLNFSVRIRYAKSANEVNPCSTFRTRMRRAMPKSAAIN